ncbi:MATE family efflux transporter [Flavobacterium phycosphaerae]|uniref:hypothetical protein n=1 Tax=Flavobacterium phycosphaerae TaxID=2697515 RepID=UPI001389867B|nr:hypothetical protein [Flavobacterium phycosphaerae]
MKNKSLKRFGLITNNTIRQILISVFSAVIPFLVIHYSSKMIWGSFVSLFLYSLLAVQIINWGNKEYLLRQFSMYPREIATNFSENITTRFPLVILFSVIGLFFFPISFGFWVLIWLLGRYLNHSVEALVLYQKKFNASILIEVISFFVFGVTFYLLKENISVYILLVLYSSYQLLKGLLYFIVFRSYFLMKKAVVKISFFKASFSFFVLSVMGFLVSKIDVYIIEKFGDTIITADYQIINSLLVFSMSVATFVYAPFTKMIYRNTDDVIAKSKKSMALIGLLIVPAALFCIFFIVEWYLKTHLPFFFYLIAFLYIYPSYVYGLDIVNLFKQHREKTVVKYLFIGVIMNALLSSLFLQMHWGITGALLGSAVTQLVVLVLFKSIKN